MRWFYIIFQLILLSILCINPLLLIIFIDNFYNLDVNSKFIFLWIITTIEFLIINHLIKTLFHLPIVNLEFTIKNFLVWNLKDKDIIIKHSLNSNLDYILLFFSKTLNTLKNIKSEFIHWQEIKSEVQIGKEIQEKMIAKQLLNIPSLDVIIKSKSAWEIWWDSYDIINFEDNYYVYVWDATWHWVWAWFIMVMVNTLISWFAKIFKSWDIILTKTNEVLKPRVKANLLMSLLLVRWEEKEKKVFMTWAWHEYLIIYKHKLKKCFKIKSWGVALGMIKDTSRLIMEKEIEFEENDIIVLYTDWVTEAINKSKKDWTEEMFWENRLIECIEKAPLVNGLNYKSSRSVFNSITIELSKFMWYKHIQLDDITLATIHYKWKDYNKELDFGETISNDFITEWYW